MKEDKFMNLKEKIEEAIKTINNTIKVNQRFELKDLFPGCEWEKIPKGDRIKLGKYLKNEVKEGNIPQVKFVDKKSNNHSEYKKTLE